MNTLGPDPATGTWSVTEANGSPWNCSGKLLDSPDVPGRQIDYQFIATNPLPNPASTPPSTGFSGTPPVGPIPPSTPAVPGVIASPPDLKTWYTPCEARGWRAGFFFNQPFTPDGARRYGKWRYDEKNPFWQYITQTYESQCSFVYSLNTLFGVATLIYTNPAKNTDYGLSTTSSANGFYLWPCVKQGGRIGYSPLDNPAESNNLTNDGWTRRFKYFDLMTAAWRDDAYFATDHSTDTWMLDMSDGAPEIYFGLYTQFGARDTYDGTVAPGTNLFAPDTNGIGSLVHVDLPYDPDNPGYRPTNEFDTSIAAGWGRHYIWHQWRQTDVRFLLDSVCIKVSEKP